jgi:hypothetical protein
MRIRRLWTVVVAAVLGALSVPTVAYAAIPSYLTLEATYTGVANGWSTVERYLDTTSGFTQESYPPTVWCSRAAPCPQWASVPWPPPRW